VANLAVHAFRQWASSFHADRQRSDAGRSKASRDDGSLFPGYGQFLEGASGGLDSGRFSQIVRLLQELVANLATIDVPGRAGGIRLKLQSIRHPSFAGSPVSLFATGISS